MDNEMIEKLLETLEETCFPVQIDWNKKDLYIKGLKNALSENNLIIIEKQIHNERNAGRKQKLNDETIAQVKYERKVYGSKISDLAKKFNISNGLVSKIINN